jgi:ribosome recycling factor
MGDVEKAIQVADLGLNPSNDGNVIRIPVPPLNEERRKEFVKILHKMAEEGKVSIRHARHAARDDIQSRIKEHEIGEDDGHRQLDEVEKLTHEFQEKIDDLLKAKEAEVMAI